MVKVRKRPTLAYADSLDKIFEVIQSTNLSESQKLALTSDVSVADTTIDFRIEDLKRKAEEEKKKRQEASQRRAQQQKRLNCLTKEPIRLQLSRGYSMKLSLNNDGSGSYSTLGIISDRGRVNWTWSGADQIIVRYQIYKPMIITIESLNGCKLSWYGEGW